MLTITLWQQHGNYLLSLGFAVGGVFLSVVLLAQGGWAWGKFESVIALMVLASLAVWKFSGTRNATPSRPRRRPHLHRQTFRGSWRWRENRNVKPQTLGRLYDRQQPFAFRRRDDGRWRNGSHPAAFRGVVRRDARRLLVAYRERFTLKGHDAHGKNSWPNSSRCPA